MLLLQVASPDKLIREDEHSEICFRTPRNRDNFGVEKYPKASSNNSVLITVEAINGGLLGFEVFHSFPEGTSSYHGIPDWIGSAPDVPQETSSEESFSWAKEWLEFCCSSHPRCNPPTVSTVLPTRLIDVQDTVENGPVKLVETCGREGRYLCLSHCWGDAENHPRPLETTNGNLRLYKEKIPWNSLPHTFQDAINFTRKLGERYIWIDSLCIIQDCKEDWGRESRKMADIYSNSYLTLAATAATNSSCGLYSRQDKVYDTRSVKVRDGGHVKCRRMRPHWPIFGTFAWSTTLIPPLLQRSWVYQERVL
ncbi:heterokaryon incompatibility protein-domain-containing protein [Phyllosticta capitalensis]